ncbi:UNVERIFIED_CONTAM: Gag-Pol polyprotein [Sesamum radiatum]|uniref:Gag-Pol polyprotein n=1 Tax=Sesamum radiatum TaxID=300843 RepID=A0AAW2VS31_SESRA
MLSPCPFMQWGMDIVGPFSLAAGQRKFLLVVIDYFSKWVETEPLARITEGEVMKFIWKNILCRFEIPREIIVDNDRQFQGQKIQEWCQGMRIKQRFTTLAHPQANGQVEVTNRILVQGIKKRGSTGESPFSLVYGTEAIIPAELGIPSHRVMNFSEECNETLLRENLYLVEELREKAFYAYRGKGAYELEDPEGHPLPRPWNVHISRNTSHKQDPFEEPPGQRGYPLLRSSEGSPTHKGHPLLRSSEGSPTHRDHPPA